MSVSTETFAKISPESDCKPSAVEVVRVARVEDFGSFQWWRDLEMTIK